MAIITDPRITVTVKSNPNNRVTARTRENLGVGGVLGDERVGARTIGIKGEDGDQGLDGAQGATGNIGPQGPIGLVWQGDWISTTIYQQRDGVSYAGGSYIYIFGVPTSNNSPPDPLYWDLLSAPGSGGDKTYVHIQTPSSNIWTIVHSLSKFPTISIIDSGNNVVEGDIEYIDANTITVTFTSTFNGRAYCN